MGLSLKSDLFQLRPTDGAEIVFDDFPPAGNELWRIDHLSSSLKGRP